MSTTTTNDLTLRQQLSLMKKSCLIDRICAACVALFIMVLVNIFLGIAFFKERQSRSFVQEAYKETLQLNEFNRIFENNIEAIRRKHPKATFDSLTAIYKP